MIVVTGEPRFAIGLKFTTRSKHPRICTVVDILKTYNSKGDMVRLRYLAAHKFMGQILTEEVPETTVAMGAIKTEKESK